MACNFICNYFSFFSYIQISIFWRIYSNFKFVQYFGNNSQTSFYLNGSIFSLIFIGDEIHVEDNNNFANLLNLDKEKEDVNFVDFLTNSLIDIISNEGDSSFSLETSNFQIQILLHLLILII